MKNSIWRLARASPLSTTCAFDLLCARRVTSCVPTIMPTPTMALIAPNQNVLLVDDLLATGGTVEACCRLVEKAGATVAGCLFLIELTSLGGAKRLSVVILSPITAAFAILFLAFAFFIVLTWYIPGLDALVPRWLEDRMYPIDKTNLGVLRLAHFLSLAVLTVRLVPRDSPKLRSLWLRPAILSGQHSLEIFCLGVFLSFAAHFAMVEINQGVIMQIATSILGIVLMIATAALISWYKQIEGQSPRPRPDPPGATLVGGGP